MSIHRLHLALTWSLESQSGFLSYMARTFQVELSLWNLTDKEAEVEKGAIFLKTPVLGQNIKKKKKKLVHGSKGTGPHFLVLTAEAHSGGDMSYLPHSRQEARVKRDRVPKHLLRTPFPTDLLPRIGPPLTVCR